MAASIAALLTPAVSALARRVPRGIAIAIVAAGTVASIAGVGYGIVGDVVDQMDALQREAPRLAGELEESGRFAEAARDARLSERIDVIVAEIPERLRGGSPADAVRSATTRGLAFLAVGVLTIFFVLHGPRLLDAARRQIRDQDQRTRAAALTEAIERRAIGYARGSALTALLSGLVAFALASVAEVPGPAPLALWVALWDLVPLVGAVVGALPIILLAAVVSPVRAGLLVVAFATWQVVEQLVLQRPIERRTVRVGPFLTVALGMAGLELYGIAGALLAVLAAAIALVVVDEVAPSLDRVPQTHGDE